MPRGIHYNPNRWASKTEECESIQKVWREEYTIWSLAPPANCKPKKSSFADSFLLPQIMSISKIFWINGMLMIWYSMAFFVFFKVSNPFDNKPFGIYWHLKGNPLASYWATGPFITDLSRLVGIGKGSKNRVSFQHGYPPPSGFLGIYTDLQALFVF